MAKRNTLKQQYYKETCNYWKDRENKPTLHYVNWLEDRLLKININKFKNNKTLNLSMDKLIKYKLKDNYSPSSYQNSPVTICPIYSDVKIGSAYCSFLCENKLELNEINRTIRCKMEKIKKDFGIFS